MMKQGDEKERAAAFALSRIYRFEPRLPRAIVENLGSAGAIFNLDKDALDEVLGPFNRHKDGIRAKSLEKWAEELRTACCGGWRYFDYLNPAFPQSLWVCEDSPLGLFVRSDENEEKLFGRPCVSVIGTRDLSSYGTAWCRKIVDALAFTVQKPCIVSGLAYGVDITAHLQALERGLSTIAVMGTGAGNIYPRQHEAYAERIVHSAGSALLTEYPPGAEILATSFLCRNRIIAGLSSATVLVESRMKGGGMSTARMAASYSRDVFAVPGRNDDLRSQGCNMLIRERVAEPVISCDDLVKALGFKRLPSSARATSSSGGGNGGVQSDRMMKLVLAIRANRDIDAPGLVRLTGFRVNDILSDLCVLENDGIICSDLLGRYSIKNG